MALDFNSMRDTIAADIASRLASATETSFAEFPVIGLGTTASWNGTATVSIDSDTSLIEVGNLIKKNSTGNWYEVSVVNADSVVVIDKFNVGSFPSGGKGITQLTATYNWDGTAVVQTNDTSEVAVGDSIRLKGDGQWFLIVLIDPNKSVTISNAGQTIPTGNKTTSKAGSQFANTTIPAPPDSTSLLETIAEPIAFAVVDLGIEVLSTSPHELPTYTVVGAAGISAPATGAMIMVTNQNGGPTPAYYDGSNWRTVHNRAVITV